jgi:hypothetical protein
MTAAEHSRQGKFYDPAFPYKDFLDISLNFGGHQRNFTSGYRG